MRNWIKIITEAQQQEWPATIDGVDLANQIMRGDMHHTPEDFSDGDIYDNICAYRTYHLKRVPISELNLELFTIHDDLVADYATMPGDSAPPIVLNPQWGLIIDGNHRANAAAKRGEADVLAYVGDLQTYEPPEEDDDGREKGW
jgi:hypothetical protein